MSSILTPTAGPTGPQRPTAAQLRAVGQFIHPAHGTPAWPSLDVCDAVGAWLLHLAQHMDATAPKAEPNAQPAGRDNLPGGAYDA